jgi:hypothetical protein
MEMNRKKSRDVDKWEGFAGRKIELIQRVRRQDLLLAPAAQSPGSLLSTGLDESEDCSEHHHFH